LFGFCILAFYFLRYAKKYFYDNNSKYFKMKDEIYI